MAVLVGLPGDGPPLAVSREGTVVETLEWLPRRRCVVLRSGDGRHYQEVAGLNYLW